MKKLLLLTFTFAFTLTTFSQTTFGPKQTINATTGDAPFAMSSGFIDNDAFADVIIGTNLGNTLEWYKNNGDGTFTIQPLIANTLLAIGGLKLVDLNNDTFLDVLASGYTNDKLVWYANDGLGNFGVEQTISSSISGASGIATGTIDAGTTIDVAVTAYDSGEVVWFSNDGSGSFTGPSTIDNSLTSQGSVNMKDIDNDGDLDALISTAAYDGNDVIEIFRNNLVPSGTVSFTKDPTSVGTGKTGIFNASFEDLDGDVNLDILVTEISFGGGPVGNLYWYEDNGAGFTETTFTTSIVNPSVAQHKDLDNDGLNDIVLSSGSSGSGNDIVWYRNLGGTYGPEQVIDATSSQAFVYNVIDLDNDLDLDIISCAFNDDDLNWFENEKFTLSNPQFQSKIISFYPNPSKESLYFTSNTLDTFRVSVFDILGKKVLKSELSVDNSLDVSKLKSGMYLLKFEGINKTYKFVKE